MIADEPNGHGTEMVQIHCVVCGELQMRVRAEREAQDSEDPDRWRCDACIAADRHLRWALTGVVSDKFVTLPYVQRLHEMAIAYLESARVLCEALGGSTTITWPRASVVYSTSNHATELFLKACILKASPQDNIGHHNVEHLQRRFVELHAGIDPPEIAWDWRVGGIPTDQLFRYGADKTGATLTNEMITFSPPIWIRWIERVEVDFRRVWSAIS